MSSVLTPDLMGYMASNIILLTGLLVAGLYTIFKLI